MPALILAVWMDSALWLEWRVLVATAILVSGASLAAVLRVGTRIPDVVTMARVALLAALIGAASVASWTLWWLALVVAALDLVDGYLARRFGPTSEGAVLDMEADQLTVVGFALLIVAGGGAPYVLFLPLMRPAFVIAAWLYGLPSNDPKPVDGDNRRGKIVCALVVGSLLIALLPEADWLREVLWLRDVVTGVAVVLLIWSFGSDWSFLAARRRQMRKGS